MLDFLKWKTEIIEEIVGHSFWHAYLIRVYKLQSKGACSSNEIFHSSAVWFEKKTIFKIELTRCEKFLTENMGRERGWSRGGLRWHWVWNNTLF